MCLEKGGSSGHLVVEDAAKVVSVWENIGLSR